MRYLLTVIAVLALASPAMSQCIGDQQVTATGDDMLPAASAPFIPRIEIVLFCSTADWRFDFCRTSQTSPSTTINVVIDCLGVDKDYPSPNWAPDACYTDGPYNDQYITDTSGGQLHISNLSANTGLFTNMDLQATDFQY